jgi:hypothetical protein
MKGQATFNLYPQVVNWDEKYGSFDKDGNKIEIDENKVAEEEARLKAEFDALEYQRQRQKEFNEKYTIGDQLDYIFHHGIEKWKTDIVQPIKDKFPKPT